MTSNIGATIRKKNGYADEESDEAHEIDGGKKRFGGGPTGDSPPTRQDGKRAKSRKSVVFEDDDNLMRTKRNKSRPGKEDDDEFEREAGSDSDPTDGRPKRGLLKSNNPDNSDEEGARSRRRKSNVSVPGEPNKYNVALARQSRAESCTNASLSPRRMIFEAKFSKYKSNKAQKKAIISKVTSAVTPKFDITTKNQSSPSRWKNHFKENMTKSIEQRQREEELMPEGYDDYLMREEVLKQKQKQAKASHADQFKMLGVNNEDKMTFFLLKWVFNAIKQESDKTDLKLKGRDFCDRKELVK